MSLPKLFLQFSQGRQARSQGQPAYFQSKLKNTALFSRQFLDFPYIPNTSVKIDDKKVKKKQNDNTPANIWKLINLVIVRSRMPRFLLGYGILGRLRLFPEVLVMARRQLWCSSHEVHCLLHLTACGNVNGNTPGDTNGKCLIKMAAMGDNYGVWWKRMVNHGGITLVNDGK